VLGGAGSWTDTFKETACRARHALRVRTHGRRVIIILLPHSMNDIRCTGRITYVKWFPMTSSFDLCTFFKLK
jgi:hypothetical protein